MGSRGASSRHSCFQARWSEHQGARSDQSRRRFARSETQVPLSTFKKNPEWRVNIPVAVGESETKGDSSDSLARMTNKDTKENITPEQYITTADVSPSHKWHPSHFSLRCVNDVCSHPS